MKIGVNLKLDVSKLDKARFFKGEKGTYCDLTAFIDTEQTGKYGDNGTISQSMSKEERQAGTKMPIVGNVKVFYTAGSDGHSYQPPQAKEQPFDDEDSSIPF
jgi:curved DNA-binding protein CbpA